MTEKTTCNDPGDLPLEHCQFRLWDVVMYRPWEAADFLHPNCQLDTRIHGTRINEPSESLKQLRKLSYHDFSSNMIHISHFCTCPDPFRNPRWLRLFDSVAPITMESALFHRKYIVFQRATFDPWKPRFTLLKGIATHSRKYENINP